WVDRFHEQEQRRWYVDILNGTCPPPHQFRPLPYFITGAVEPLIGDWRSASFLYRWFVTYGFLWATYQFGLLFIAPRRALLVVAAVVVLYPFSIAYYHGQLTDPLSHMLFVLGMVWIVEDRLIPLIVALALGIA